ncbi:MAG: hypothetical protein LBM98_06400 [Oscillospiraceae bacterium]|nr:hypothetical protein [Oscillospiraceae bacterium]
MTEISTAKNVNRQYLAETFAEAPLPSFFGAYMALWFIALAPIGWLALARPLAIILKASDSFIFAYNNSVPMVIIETTLAFALLLHSWRYARRLRKKYRAALKDGGKVQSQAAQTASSSETIAYYMMGIMSVLLIAVNCMLQLVPTGAVTSYALFGAIGLNPQTYYGFPVFAERYFVINRWTIAYDAIAYIEAPEGEHSRKGKLNESRGIWFYNAEGKLVGRDRFFTDDYEFLRRKLEAR